MQNSSLHHPSTSKRQVVPGLNATWTVAQCHLDHPRNYLFFECEGY